MSSIFHYTYFLTRLERNTRSLYVTLKPQEQEAFCVEALFECESLLVWCKKHVEIQHVIFDFHLSWSRGATHVKLQNMTAQKIERIQQKIQSLVQHMLEASQAIIFVLPEVCHNWALELSLGADFRFVSRSGDYRFNHHEFGLMPTVAMGLLPLMWDQASAHFLLQAQGPVNLQTAQPFFQIYDASNREELVAQLLQKLSQQAPIQKIQTKLGLTLPLLEEWSRRRQTLKSVIKAGLMSEDWKKQEGFMAPQLMSHAVKLSLIKTEEVRTEH
jgi:enoyl-CoA hydratase/carnithine racemase